MLDRKARLWGRAAAASPVELREPQHWLRMTASQPSSTSVAFTPTEIAQQHESVSAATAEELYDHISRLSPQPFSARKCFFAAACDGSLPASRTSWAKHTA
eukprot:1364553-Amphidinium_carterae.1